ncbi:MAG: T9SS type A sorting domain-containing protein [Bacteroidales bacterium]
MRQISILIFGIMIYTNIMANDCEIITFNSNYSSNYNNTDVFFIKGVKLKTIYHGIQLKILEDFKQNLQEDTIMVWCSDGNSFRVENSACYNDNDTLYMLITKTDLEGNDPGDLNEIPDDLEKLDDYMPIHCAYSILKYSNGFITGKITSIQQDITISVLDFFNQLSTGFNLPNSKWNIKLFPNPVSSELYITMNDNIGLPVKTEIYNNNGQLIQSSINGAIEYVVNTSTLNKGTYFVKIIDNSNKCLISKFIKL